MDIFFVVFVLPVLLLLSGDSDFIFVFEFNSYVVHFIGVLMVMLVFDDVVPP